MPCLSSAALQEDPEGLAFLRAVLAGGVRSGAPVSGRPEPRRRCAMPAKTGELPDHGGRTRLPVEPHAEPLGWSRAALRPGRSP